MVPLEEYRAKRDFAATPEPAGGEPSSGAARFVVQQHHASRMHFDFRLEHDGVLLSWAVPKGPSFDTAAKRLAVRTEDHPLDYADFEGVIPAGQYGAGSVIVWDRGVWEPVGDAATGLAKGELKFRLNGEKLTGGWVLVRLKPRGGERAENWLLIKERDEHVRATADFDVTAARPESVLSGRRVGEVSGEAAPAEPSIDPPSLSPPSSAPPLASITSGAPPDLALCTLVTDPPAGDSWLTEVKYDGYRLTVRLEDGTASCRSRAGADVTRRFRTIARATETLPASSALLDGEAVIFDEHGTTDFAGLQRLAREAPERVSYVAFDLLELNGHDLRTLGTSQRKDLLRELLRDAPPSLRFAEHVAGDAVAFFEIACAQGLEGAVFKRADAQYVSGRTRHWLKAKCRRSQEFVIGGFTEPRGSRSGFGALLLGVYDDGALRYAGRVGSGLSDADIARLSEQMSRRPRATSPFSAVPPDLVARGPRWVRPDLVAQVAFAEWTVDGLLRQPSFLGLREDIPARSVRREDPVRLRATDDDPRAGDANAGPPAVAGITISNPDKRLFPGSGFTKLDLARFYERAASYLLREVSERPLTLVRCPVGDTGACFYQRHPERGLSERVRTFAHALRGHETAEEWLYVDSLSGVVALAQMGVAEIHTWQSRVDAPTRPDQLVFDLDPGPDVSWERVCEAGLIVRDELSRLGLSPFLKSTGSKGVHVVVPIEPVWEFDRVHALARGFAEHVSARRPDLLTARIAKEHRRNLIFVDYVRNSEGASAIAAYSTRHLPGPTVAVPLAWDELHAGFDPRTVVPAEVLKRLGGGVDPWGDIESASAGARILRSAESALLK